MRTLRVELAERGYPIHIGEGLLRDGSLYRPHVAGSQVMIVTNETVAPLYLEQVRSALSGLRVEEVVLPDGEEHKTLATLERVFHALLSRRFDRGCTLVALGGGVIGDITGFAAACYQRGVEFIQIPTTLLAQVDSSVGGKTGVNHPLGKNMIGAFHQPRCVIADIATLRTLDDRQLAAGAAEVIKYGLIRDRDFFEALERRIDSLLARDVDTLGWAIERSCALKAEIVGRDERESGERALLNLGHTFGHAIETGVGYGEWLHGEAVGAGMCMAADLSHRLGWIGTEARARAIELVRRARLPIGSPKGMTPARYRDLMAVDKKVQDGALRLVLLQSIGKAVVTADYDPQALDATLQAYCKAAA